MSGGGSKSLEISCLRCWWDVILLADDPPEQRVRKVITTYCAMSAWVMFPIRTGFMHAEGQLTGAAFIFKIALQLVGLGMVVPLYLWYRRHMSHRFTVLVALVSLVILAFNDLDRAARGEARAWPAFVLVLDMLLMEDIGRSTFHAFLALCAAWLVLVTLDQYIRFGLLDTPFVAGEKERREMACSCDRFPCQGAGTFTSFMSLIVLCLDVIFKKHFVDTVSVERRRMAAAVDVADDIAASLAAFDLVSASRELSSPNAACLPKRLSRAYRSILRQLEVFRPYIPTCVLNEVAASITAAPTPAQALVPPGQISGRAAIAFTDIRLSTSIWEVCGSAMTHALKQHNLIIRSAIPRFGGYEVKTIGDSFMLAFEAMEGALRCCFELHETLLATDWPQGIMRHPACRRDENGLWGGLTVRIGVAYGEVVAEVNDVTQRCDYFGDVVNRASRLEGMCEPGGVLGVANQIRDVLPAVNLVPEDCTTSECRLRGFADSVVVMTAYPRSLAGRKHLPHSDLVSPIQHTIPVPWTDRFMSQSLLGSSCGSDCAHAVGAPPQPHSSRGTLSMNRLYCPLTEHSVSVMSLVLSVPTASRELPAHVTDATNRFLDIIGRHLSPTGGNIVTFINDNAIVAWRGSGHLDAMMKFLVSFRASCRDADNVNGRVETCVGEHEVNPGAFTVRAGLASGRSLVGTSGTGEQSFYTVTGPAPSFAVQMSREATGLDIQNLYATAQSTTMAVGRIGECLTFAYRATIARSGDYVWNTSTRGNLSPTSVASRRSQDATEDIDMYEVSIVDGAGNSATTDDVLELVDSHAPAVGGG